MGTIRHFCQDVKGALRNWNAKTWRALGADNGISGEEMKGWFRIYEFEGKKVIPLTRRPCKGFSYEIGCPGHETKGDKQTTE